MIDYMLGASIMLQLGRFQFGVNTAAYQRLQRATEYRWPSQDRFGQREALQFVGPGADTITLPGVIYPEWRGGLRVLDDLRELAAEGRPQTMIDGLGNILGRWVIERVEETQTVFADAGVPRKQEFTVQLRRYHGDEDAE
jgi:phage protein U